MRCTTSRFRFARIVIATAFFGIVAAVAHAQEPASPTAGVRTDTLEDALRAFYSARYEAAAKLTIEPCASEVLEACELRTAALLFQIRRALGDAPDKDASLKRCETCPALQADFKEALTKGQTIARARLKTSPQDDDTLFLLGKLDLNYVWLELGTLGRRTGWSEYWEARKSIDAVLTRRPEHVRARVARAWINYIVGTRMRAGTRWILGGGSKNRGMQAMKEAAAAEADFFTRAEAMFGLWDMQVRERDLIAATSTARVLARDFPDNDELKRFLDKQPPPARESR